MKEAEDALARATHEGLDLLLRGRGRGVEHLALAISPFGDFGPAPAPTHPARFARALAVRRVHTVEKDGVKVRVEPEVAICALDDRHGAGLASRQTAVDMPPPIPPRHGVREDAHDLAEQLPVEREREAQGEGHREHELSDRDIRQNVVHQVQGALAHPPAEAARAHRSCFARERHGVVLAAGIAVQVGKTSPQNPAVHERVQLVCHKLGQRLAAGLVGPLLLEGQKVLLQHLVEGSLFRLPARVDRAR